MTKYVNNNGVSEMWLNIKNWVTSQLLGYSQTGHTHTKSQITDLDLSNYVDKTSNQTISGPKTFTSVPTVKKDSAGDLLYLIDDTINTSNEDENGFPLTGHTNSLKIRGRNSNMIPCMLTGQVFTNGDTSAELRAYKYKDISSSNSRAILSLRYIYNSNYGIATFSNVSFITPNVTNTTNLGSSALQWNSTYTRHICIDNDINIWSSTINKTSNSGSLSLRGGTNYADGASIGLYGKDYNSTIAGAATITAYGNSDYTIFYLYPNGTMSVYNNSTDITKSIAMQEDVNTLLNGKANSSHTHTKSEITDFPTLATVATSGSYNDLSNKPTIPSKTSDLTNDSGFITSDNTKIPLAGSNQISGSLIPATTDAYNLGGPSYQWNNAYIKSLIINGVACGDILTHNASEFVPTSGGAVMTNYFLGRSVNTGSFMISGGTGWSSGGSIESFGSSHSSYAGQVRIQPALSDSNFKTMTIQPNGTWTWNGSACSVSSDSRLKDEISDISDEVLDAWENLEPKQYKLKSELETDKDNAQIHYGWIAQDVESIIKGNRKGDIKNGLWLHEEWEEQKEVSHEEKYTEEVETKDGKTKTVTKTRKVVDSPYRAKGDSYGLRYTECLVVECKYLRRCIARLTARIEELEKGNNVK